MQTLVINPDNRERMIQRVHAFLSALPAGNWKISIAKHVKTRTDQQNAALFGVAYPPLCKHIGCTPDELHEIMCMKAFGTKETTIAGIVRTSPMRTTTRNERGERDVIDVQRFSDFYSMVQQIGAECGVWVPDPDPLNYYTRNEA